ncbi:hypothetical protein RIF29_34816 [Crotalaria pallida]|uniref:RING-type E3 ubiquitin transferase n=1 Tax=Crotalaria pallida TaxID=3830 RepID=A0AAN9HXK8_CROPI
MDNVNVVISRVSESNTNRFEAISLPLSNHNLDLGSFDLAEALTLAGESCHLLAVSKTFVARASLPTVEEDLKMMEDDVCSICIEGFGHHNSGVVDDDEGIKRIPCGHVYHSNCITLWLSYSNSCPLCRKHISPSPLFQFHSN